MHTSQTRKKLNIGLEKKCSTEDVDKLLTISFVREVYYLNGSNIVMMKESNGKW